MDELQSSHLNNENGIYFCESTAPFTVEQTARLVGQALGSAADADAAIIPYAPAHQEGAALLAGITGRLYRDRINTDVAWSIGPGLDGEYAVLTMTGAQAKELAEAGFAPAGDGEPYPCVLVTRGGGELEDGQTCRVAFLMGSYTEEMGQACHAQVTAGYVWDILRDWLAEQKVVSPDETRWE